MHLYKLAQQGVITNPTKHAEYLTMILKNNVDQKDIKIAISNISNVQKSISQKDDNCELTVTVGFAANA